MAETPKFTDVLPEGMPDAAALIEELRAAGSQAEREEIVSRYPDLGLLAPVPVLAQWLGMREQSVYMSRSRRRPGGEPVWPDAEETILGRMMWTFRGIALHRASAPGRGWNLRAEIREGAK